MASLDDDTSPLPLPPLVATRAVDAARPALVSWLGVTMYLEQRVTVATLTTLRRVLAPGITL